MKKIYLAVKYQYKLSKINISVHPDHDWLIVLSDSIITNFIIIIIFFAAYDKKALKEENAVVIR